MLRERYATCEKCQSRWQVVFLYNDRWLGKACNCYDEEQEKDSPKIDKDLEWLEQYRQLCQGTRGIVASTYSQ